ncbi:Ran GAP Rna1 [Teratosphaeriaceae sp. CCFEE 6253]|nr:Ran GAP Rna1 [Teratosphaeriaceae sp. CCFEE 6253]
MTNTFSLRGRALKLGTAADIEPHLAPLRSNPDIEEIHLEGNTLGVGACAALADVLETKSHLRSANLADIFTGRLLTEIPPALDSLLKALLKCPKLHTINLSDNAFGLNTVEPLRPFLSQHTPLQHLYLNNNGLGPAAGALVAEALAQLAERKEAARKEGKEISDLETVVCGRNRLETGSMKAWVQAYQANSHVKVVKMVQNGIRQEGIALLIKDGLSTCKELRVLDLQDNTFTTLASTQLSRTLPSWPSLLDLGVGDCLLGARGGRNVATALSQGQNTKIEVLRLQFNELDTKAVHTLVSAALSKEALPRLRRVELNGNKFAEEDPEVEKLRELLERRKEEAGETYTEVDAEDEDAWGLDELDELDDEDEDEEEDAGGKEDQEDEEDEEEVGDVSEAAEEKILKEADQAESEPVSQKQDKDVDELADTLGKTELK